MERKKMMKKKLGTEEKIIAKIFWVEKNSG